VRAGNLRAELVGADLTRIRWGGLELASAIQVTVRDEHWGTLAPRVLQAKVDERPDGFTVALDVVHGDDAFAWRGAIRADDGTLELEMSGSAERDLLYRRIGICVLHPWEGYAGARFTVTPMTASRAAEAEVKFAQGAKPGKGGQLPGKKVAPRIAAQRGCEPGYELVSPPVNHNLYSIEDVKLMVESWRHLNPDVRAALKFVATHGVEMACMGGVNAGANRLHLSDGCGGTGAAKRVDQKHGGVPVAAVLPAVQDMLVEEGVRERVELSVDGAVVAQAERYMPVLLDALASVTRR